MIRDDQSYQSRSNFVVLPCFAAAKMRRGSSEAFSIRGSCSRVTPPITEATPWTMVRFGFWEHETQLGLSADGGIPTYHPKMMTARIGKSQIMLECRKDVGIDSILHKYIPGSSKRTAIHHETYIPSLRSPVPPNSNCVSSCLVEASKITQPFWFSIAQMQVTTLNLGVAKDCVGYCWPLMRWLFVLKNPQIDIIYICIEIGSTWLLICRCTCTHTHGYAYTCITHLSLAPT